MRKKRFNIKEWQDKYLTESDTIKYKSDDGEAKEMDADAAAKQPEDHPAKIAWEKTQDKDDGGGEETKGADMFAQDAGEKGEDEEYQDDDDEEGGEEDELESLKAKRDDLQQQRSDVKKDIMANRDDKEMVSMLVQQRDEIKEDLEEVEEEIEMLQQMESIHEIIGKTGRAVLGRRIK